MNRKWLAEAIGTMWLVLGGCGTAVLAGGHVGFNGVSLAFGLTVLTMAYTIGSVSGCHLNPAVTIGLAAAGRFDKKDVPGYVISQVAGAIVGALVIFIVAKGSSADFSAGDPTVGDKVVGPGFASNGFGDRSPGHFNLLAAFITEVVLTAFFLLVILGTTSKKAAAGFAGLAIGLALTLIHLISIPVTNTSVNPARSTSQAIFAGGGALLQLPVFWVAPILGAILGAIVWKMIGNDGEEHDEKAAA
jgi:aquaporin Z